MDALFNLKDLEVKTQNFPMEFSKVKEIVMFWLKQKLRIEQEKPEIDSRLLSKVKNELKDKIQMEEKQKKAAKEKKRKRKKTKNKEAKKSFKKTSKKTLEKANFKQSLKFLLKDETLIQHQKVIFGFVK